MEDIKLCQPCNDDGNQTEAFGFCLDCGEYLCQDCYQGHCKPRPMRNHTLLDMDQMKKETPTIRKKDTVNELSTQHGGEYIKYFCSTHNVTGCSACITIDHLNCSGNVVFIPQVAESVVNSDELQSLKTNIKAMSTPLTDMITTCTDNVALVEANHSELTKAILEYGEEVISAIQHLEKSSRSTADAFKQDNMDTANAVIRTCKESLSMLHEMMKELQIAEETNNYCKLFIAVKTHNKATRDIQDNLNQMTVTSKIQPLIFNPLKEIRSFLNKLDGLGVFSDKPSSPDCSLEYSSSEPEHEETGPVNVNVSFIHDTYIRSATDHGKFCQVTSIVLMSRNKLILTDEGQRKVKLVDIDRAKVVAELRFENLENVIRPLELVKVDSSKVIVRLEDGDCILVNVGTSLTIDRLVTSVSSPDMSNDENFDILCHNSQYHQRDNAYIATHSHMSFYPNDGLYICNQGPKITKFDLFGNETSLIKGYRHIEGELHFSGSLIKTAESKQTCFYTVVTNHKCFKQLRIKQKIGTPYVACMTSDGYFRRIDVGNKPQDIAVDKTGRVLFVLSDGIVHVLEAGTTDAHALWTKTNGLCRACAVAYCPDTKRLYVGMSDSNNVKVYQLSGMPLV